MKNLDQEFKKIAKKSKIKRWLITTSISVGVVAIATFAAWRFDSAQVTKAYFGAAKTASIYNEIEAPNIHVKNQIGTSSTNMHSDTYKYLDGVPVAWQGQNWTYQNFSLSGLISGGTDYNYQFSSPAQIGNALYTQGTSQKIALFFPKGAKYEAKDYVGVKPTADITELKNLPNHLAEVAVTFDKAYSYDEIQKLIPDNLLINWYWIGVNSTNNVQLEILTNQALFYGLSSDLSSGKLIKEDYKNFVDNVKLAKSKLSERTYNGFNPLKDAVKQVEKYPDLKTAKFSGVILTGRTENFAQLAKVDWIEASSLGLSTEYLPSQELVKGKQTSSVSMGYFTK